MTLRTRSLGHFSSDQGIMTICGLDACIVPAAPAPHSDAWSWQGWGKHHGSTANPGCQEGSRGTLAPYALPPHLVWLHTAVWTGCEHYCCSSHHCLSPPVTWDYTRTRDSGPSPLLVLPVAEALASSRASISSMWGIPHHPMRPTLPL